MKKELASFAPIFEAPTWTARERKLLKPFFTNLTESVYGITIPNPEVVGAICSRASRAKGDLREVFLREFLLPFLEPERKEDDTDEDWAEKQRAATQLQELVDLLKHASIEERMANPKARAFFDRWLSQFGDDSIAQTAGTHIAYAALSQVALKHLEDQRIGLAPIEQSTRYVDYGGKVDGRYRYYTPGELSDANLRDTYEGAMDNLFATYADLVPRVHEWLMQQYPDVSRGVCEKKAFDLLRGLLPMSTLSQVAFSANGQAAEYLITRARAHTLSEIQWAGERTREEWQHVIPSFIRRVDGELGGQYQQWLRDRRTRLNALATTRYQDRSVREDTSRVTLLDYQQDGQERVIAALLYNAPDCETDFRTVLEDVTAMSDDEKRKVLDAHFDGREERWQKAHRAFEFGEVTFEIVMNAGAYRDLHRHRMLSQERQSFTVIHGYDVPDELVGTEFEAPFREAIEGAEEAYFAIREAHNAEVAQYATTLTHRVRFVQVQKVRSAYWTIELRTIPEGHPDYRVVEQEKYRLLAQAYPLLADAKYVHVDLEDYVFARRGQEQRIAAKQEELKTLNE